MCLVEETFSTDTMPIFEQSDAVPRQLGIAAASSSDINRETRSGRCKFEKHVGWFVYAVGLLVESNILLFVCCNIFRLVSDAFEKPCLCKPLVG